LSNEDFEVAVHYFHPLIIAYNVIARKYSMSLPVRQSCDRYSILIDLYAILWHTTYRQKNGASRD
jgi:hypothetical protein